MLIMLGLVKKAVLADHLSAVIDPVLGQPGEYATQALWLATLGYAVQIYCDFSGYSDMAIGLAHTLGFKLPMNFNMPYFAANIADFWRRWHISLSSWLRDYLYIPLGGSRGGSWATYRNLMLTMVLGGFWHGASWTFVFWGFFHGLLLAVHRGWTAPAWYKGACPAREHGRHVPRGLRRLGLFPGQTFADAGSILHGLVSPRAGLVLLPYESMLISACLLITFLSHLVGSGVKLRRLEQTVPAPWPGRCWP